MSYNSTDHQVNDIPFLQALTSIFQYTLYFHYRVSMNSLIIDIRLKLDNTNDYSLLWKTLFNVKDAVLINHLVAVRHLHSI